MRYTLVNQKDIALFAVLYIPELRAGSSISQMCMLDEHNPQQLKT